MRRTITKEHALKIVRKLRATVDPARRAHDLASVFYKDILVTQFGLRRGSNKDLPHSHVVEDLHLNLRQTLDLANCPLSYEQWLRIMIEKGLIEDTASE